MQLVNCLDDQAAVEIPRGFSPADVKPSSTFGGRRAVSSILSLLLSPQQPHLSEKVAPRVLRSVEGKVQNGKPRNP